MKKISGIYKITNIINSKIYIGSAVNIDNRIKQHKHLLKNNKHFNSHLQTSYNKYGVSNFIYEIIEVVDINNLIEREQYWIKQLNVNDNKIGYNKRRIATSNLGIKYSDDAKEKLRISHLGHKRNANTQMKISESQYIKICQLTIDGIYLKTFNSLQDAANSLGVNYTSGISGCIRKINKSAHGYRWCYEEEYDKFKSLNFKKNGWHRCIKIEVINILNGEKNIFNSIVDASRTLNIPISTIHKQTKNKIYIWKKI